jgi:hypothetical protein
VNSAAAAELDLEQMNTDSSLFLQSDMAAGV